MAIDAAGAAKILRRPAVKRILRFIVVGAVNAAFGYGLFALFIFLGLIPEVALLVATVVGVLFNFYSTGKIVFRDNRKSCIFGFLTVYLCVYVVDAAALRLLTYFAVSPMVSQFVLLPWAAALTYITLQNFVYGKYQ
jgi:putative flippase GtrA